VIPGHDLYIDIIGCRSLLHPTIQYDLPIDVDSYPVVGADRETIGSGVQVLDRRPARRPVRRSEARARAVRPPVEDERRIDPQEDRSTLQVAVGVVRACPVGTGIGLCGFGMIYKGHAQHDTEYHHQDAR
jgi:hypothetical protein